MVLVVHPHFHRRRTGVTRHVESVVPALCGEFEARAIGPALESSVPRIGWRELWSRLRREPMVWHAHRVNELVVGLLLRVVGRRLHLVFTRHSARAPGLLTRALARKANRVVSLTPQVAEMIGVPSSIVGHGVDLARFSPAPSRASAWTSLGQGGARGVGVIGRVREEKGQAEFVEAVAPLLVAHPQWRAVLVGRVKPAQVTWAEGLRAATGGALLLAGEREDVLPWYRGLSIIVQPSRSEGFGLVLLEAMAAGCCVVAARLPHYGSLIDHGRTGFLYPPGDLPALRELLAQLMATPDQAEQIGGAAAEEARRRFGVEHEAKALQDLYRGLQP